MLLQFKDIPLRTRRVLSLYKVYGDSALLVFNGTSLNCNNALLALTIYTTVRVFGTCSNRHGLIGRVATLWSKVTENGSKIIPKVSLISQAFVNTADRFERLL